jgi:hypothetical protein
VTAHPRPGPDEIALSEPAAGDLCHSLDHLHAGRAATVRVTFGELGTRHAGALWPECWHHSYLMCGPCWQATRKAADRRRPGLVICDVTGAPASSGDGSGP